MKFVLLVIGVVSAETAFKCNPQVEKNMAHLLEMQKYQGICRDGYEACRERLQRIRKNQLENATERLEKMEGEEKQWAKQIHNTEHYMNMLKCQKDNIPEKEPEYSQVEKCAILGQVMNGPRNFLHN